MPENVLPQQKMVEILYDMHLLEGARSGTMILGDTNSLPDYYSRVYQKHQVSEQQFKESFYWYTLHPNELKLVYDDLIIELTTLEAEEKVRSAGQPGSSNLD
jgi:hypothetical protein